MPNAPVTALADDDLDESTLVRPRQAEVVDEVTVVEPRRDHSPLLQPLPPPAPPSVNPWRIMIPAAIALVAVFGVVFLLTRGSGQTASPNANFGQTGLVPDPNSSPVQPMGTPTGASEQNIQPQPSATPTPRVAEVNANQAPATVTGNFGANNNRDAPTPKPTAKPDEDPAPPPKPTATVRSAPKATPTPEGN